MVAAPGRRVGALPLLLTSILALPACFDVHDVAPGFLSLDDFDDGDYVPTLQGFDAWECLAYNPPTNKDFSCPHGPGDQSEFGLSLDFTIVDPKNGIQEHGGAFLATLVKSGPIDFTRYQYLTVSTRLQSGSPPLPSEAKLYIQLTCGTAPGDVGSTVADLYVETMVVPTSEWSTARLSLAAFLAPSWRDHHVASTPACLKLIDGFHASVDASLPDGESGQGTLSIDSIRLE